MQRLELALRGVNSAIPRKVEGLPSRTHRIWLLGMGLSPELKSNEFSEVTLYLQIVYEIQWISPVALGL